MPRRPAVATGGVVVFGQRVIDPPYQWQTHIFSGDTAVAATQAFDTWFGYQRRHSLDLTQQPILRTPDAHLYCYLTHHPMPDHYEIHVTALMKVESTDA